VSERTQVIPDIKPTFTRLPGSAPTWREKTVIRILLIIASMLVDDPEIKREISHLGSHIAVAREARDDA
jgi:hypothetical protein